MADERDDAARWFAAERRGLMSHEERQDYERWLALPAHAAALAEVRQLWNELGAAGSSTNRRVLSRSSSRTLLAAMIGLVSLTLAMAARLDAVWWNTLDWWSR